MRIAVVVDVGAVDAAPVWEVVEAYGLFVAEVADLFAAGVVTDLPGIAPHCAAGELLAADDAVGEFHFHFNNGGCRSG